MIEVLKQALEALDEITDDVDGTGLNTTMSFDKSLEAITSLRQAIAELESQEPVAWRTFDGEGQYEYRAYEDNEDYGLWWEERHPNHKNWVEPLYTHPLQRKPLTDEEIVAINDKHYNIAYRDFDADIAIARAIEAAHGIKGES